METTNIFIEDCTRELSSNTKVQTNFESLKILSLPHPIERSYDYLIRKHNQSSDPIKMLLVLTLLSRTPKGQAVMPFLDVERHGTYDRNRHIHTLDHYLFNEFTEALRIGKGFDQALELITKIYIKELK